MSGDAAGARTTPEPAPPEAAGAVASEVAASGRLGPAAASEGLAAEAVAMRAAAAGGCQGGLEVVKEGWRLCSGGVGTKMALEIPIPD